MGRHKSRNRFGDWRGKQRLVGLTAKFRHVVWYLLRKTGIAWRLPDRLFLQIQYYLMMGRRLRLNPPVDFNEKIQWIKLYYHDRRMVLCADKYAVREFVKERIGEKYLNECYGVYERVEDIDWTALPNQFVIKGTHGSAMNLLCRDKAALDLEQVKPCVAKWFTTDYSRRGREWHYGQIKPRVICEKLLVDRYEPYLLNYRFLAFKGQVKCIWVEYNRQGVRTTNFYDANWVFQPDKTNGVPNGRGEDVERPECLAEMLDLVRKLASDFIECRVDFYLIEKKKIVFGEMTFTSGNGCNEFMPLSFCEELGRCIDLPEKMV